MDGRGAWEATTIWHGHNGRLDPVLMIPFPDSVGYFYSAFTEFLGFQPNSDEWKVMGLAPYGKAGRGFVQLYRCEGGAVSHSYQATERQRHDSVCGMTARLGPPRIAETAIDERHKDIAYAVQDACEIAMMKRGADGDRKNGMQECLPCRRRGAEFESQRENCSFQLCWENLRAARGLG